MVFSLYVDLHIYKKNAPFKKKCMQRKLKMYIFYIFNYKILLQWIVL